MRRHATPRTLATALAAAALLLLPAAAGADHTGADYAGGVERGDEYRGSADDAYPAGYGDPGAGTYDAEPEGYDTGYSFIRSLEGSATLIEAGGERQQAEINMPVLTGDRLWVAPRSRVELLLSDGNLLRLDADSEVAFTALALSPEADDRATVLQLREGNLQLVVFADALGDELPRVDLPNATFYAGEAGRYRLTSAGGDWSQVVVRSGWAEVVTERGATPLRSGEELLADGARAPRTLTRQASGYDTLERWGQELDERVARGDQYAGLDRSLRYAAAPLEDHGAWISVAGQRAWRPYVDDDWAPYSLGRWTHTRIGLTWVSYEPWGWVPYHYGSWDFIPGRGWVWYPGARFAPAWVYWYWGPSHVAWVPAGYYTRFYRHRFHFGVFGWYGGGWDHFHRWVVCPTSYLGHRHQNRYAHDGRYWHRRYGDHPVPRGIIATDTRPLGRDQWRDPDEAMRVLRTRPGVIGRDGGDRERGNRGRLAQLPDMTPYVARSPELPDEVRRVVRVDATPGRTVRGTGGGSGISGRGGVADGPRTPVVRSRPGTTQGEGSDPGPARGRASDGRPTVIQRPGLDGLRTPRGGVSDDADRGRQDGAREPQRITRPRTPAPRDREDGAGAGSGRDARPQRPRVYTSPRGEDAPRVRGTDGPRTGTPRTDPPAGVARSPRFRGDGGSSARPTPPPRSQRVGSPEPPARRVIRGARSAAGRSSAGRSATDRSTTRRRTTAGPSSTGRSGADRPSARSSTRSRAPVRRPSAGSSRGDTSRRTARPSSPSRSSGSSSAGRSSGSASRSSARSRSSGRDRSSARSRSSSRSSGRAARSRDRDDG